MEKNFVLTKLLQGIHGVRPREDTESEAESADQDDKKAVKFDYKDMIKFEGYENTKFGIGLETPPPKLDEPPKEKPAMTYTDVFVSQHEDIREALLQHVNRKFCSGSRAARSMEFNTTSSLTAFHYTLETYGEKRTTKYESKPYKGGPVDGPDKGEAPKPWDIVCPCKEFFVDQKRHLEVPHTSVVKACHRCQACGLIKCSLCHATGRTRCGSCYGRGRKRVKSNDGCDLKTCLGCYGSGMKECPRCVGQGQITCPKCEGFTKVRIYIGITVTFKNYKTDYKLDVEDVPDAVRKKASETIVFEQILDKVFPLTSYPVTDVTNSSQRLIKKHASDCSKQKIHQQRQTLRAVPVTEVEGSYNGSQKTFWVYGMEKKVYFPDYPHKCCWLCQIL